MIARIGSRIAGQALLAWMALFAGTGAAGAQEALELFDPDDGQLVLAQALEAAATGRLEAAHAVLTGPLAEDPTWGPDFRRHGDRVGALAELREAFLEARLAGRDELRLDVGDTVLEGRLASREGGMLVLEGDAGVIEVPETELEPGELVNQLKRAKDDGGSPALRVYACLLSRDPRWRKLASGEARKAGADARTLLSEEEALDEAFALADAARALAQVLEHDGDAVGTWTGLLELLDRHGSSRLVASHRGTLKAQAEDALQELSLALGLESMELGGEVEGLGDDRLRLTYTFDDASQLDDFRSEAAYLDYFRKSMHGLQEPGSGSMKVEKGNLVIQGDACLRHELQFLAPMTVEYAILWKRGSASQQVFHMGFCDNGAGALVRAFDLGSVEAFEPRERFAEFSMSPRMEIPHDKVFRIKVVHDGKRVTTYVDGEETVSIDPGPRTSGGLYLWSHTDRRIELQELVVEATLDPAAVRGHRERWVVEQLARLDG